MPGSGSLDERGLEAAEEGKSRDKQPNDRRLEKGEKKRHYSQRGYGTIRLSTDTKNEMSKAPVTKLMKEWPVNLVK